MRRRPSSPASLAQAERTLAEISKKLRSSTRTVEKVILAAAPGLLGQGEATVINQHLALDRAYRYFRERALNPVVIADEATEHTSSDGRLTGVSFRSGRIQMHMNAFHDLVAAITAFLSRLEHDLVIALAFAGFDPDTDDLLKIIGSRWGEKFDRVLGDVAGAAPLRERLTAIVERWRNPYSHGGFEKGHAATIYLHAPDVGAVPVGLSSVRNSPLFSLFPVTESDMNEVFAVLDDLDAWMKSELPNASLWIESGLPIPFDGEFRRQSQDAIRTGEFDEFVRYREYLQERANNMDY